MLSIDAFRTLAADHPNGRPKTREPCPPCPEDGSLLARVVASVREGGVLAGLEGGAVIAVFSTEAGSVVLGFVEEDLVLVRCRDTHGGQWYRTSPLTSDDRAGELARIVQDCFKQLEKRA